MIDLNTITAGVAGVLDEANAINDYGRVGGSFVPDEDKTAFAAEFEYPFPGSTSFLARGRLSRGSGGTEGLATTREQRLGAGLSRGHVAYTARRSAWSAN
jgi:hypothetical protein